MKRKIIIPILIAAAVAILCGCKREEPQTFTGSLLWKISGNGLSKPSYILGTHHFAEVSMLDKISGFEKALASAKTMAGEILLDDMPAVVRMMMERGLMDEGMTYQDILSEEDYEFVNNYLNEKLGMGLESLGRFKPAYISTMLMGDIYNEAVPEFNALTHKSIDQYVQERSKEAGKEIVGLETAEDQVRVLFDVEPIEVQADNLVESIRDTDTAVELLKKLNACYDNADLDGMYDLSFNNPDGNMQVSEEYEYAINKERNDKWLAKLPGLMSERPVFVAVGALHLAGEEGLLRQLHAMGYKVTPVK